MPDRTPPMTLTFDLIATCPECGCRMSGFEMLFGVKVNINSLRSKQSLGVRWPCPECGFTDHAGHMSDWLMRLQPDDSTKVASRREQIRARNRRAKAAL